MGIEVGGLLGLIVLIADIWAIVKTFDSPATTGKKFLDCCDSDPSGSWGYCLVDSRSARRQPIRTWN